MAEKEYIQVRGARANNLQNINVDIPRGEFVVVTGLSGNIRIDTHKDNKIMQGLLARHGFSYCGIIYLKNGSPRLAYQRVL